MKAMSPTDIVVGILKKKGEWAESSDLLDVVMKERGVSDRQAYRDIKCACKESKIRKIELPDRAVLYGLPNWPFPKTPQAKPQKETLTFQDAFYYRCFKKLEKITNENIDGSHLRAYQYLKHLKATLPQPLKDKLDPFFEQAEKTLHNTKGVDFYTTLLAKERIAFSLVQCLVDKVSTLLHQQFEL